MCTSENDHYWKKIPKNLMTQKQNTVLKTRQLYLNMFWIARNQKGTTCVEVWKSWDKGNIKGITYEMLKIDFTQQLGMTKYEQYINIIRDLRN